MCDRADLVSLPFQRYDGVDRVYGLRVVCKRCGIETVALNAVDYAAPFAAAEATGCVPSHDQFERYMRERVGGLERDLSITKDKLRAVTRERDDLRDAQRTRYVPYAPSPFGPGNQPWLRSPTAADYEPTPTYAAGSAGYAPTGLTPAGLASIRREPLA